MLVCPTPDVVEQQITAMLRSRKAIGHVCNARHCNIRNFPVEIHVKAKLFYIKHPFHKQPWMTAATVHRKVVDIYCCKNTGKIHYCHAKCCGDKIVSDNNTETCTITGQQFDCLLVQSYGAGIRSQGSKPVDKSDPLKCLRDKDGRVTSIGVHNIKEEESKKEAATLIYACLFSVKRIEYERMKEAELMREGEKIVNRYKRHMDQTKQKKVYIVQRTLFENIVRRRPAVLPYLRKTPKEAEATVNDLTRRVLAYWKMILFQTMVGMENPSQFNFRHFTPSCLYLMKEGITSNGVAIIPKDRYLQCSLPNPNTLEHYGVQTKQFTKTKKYIVEAIRHTIWNKKHTAEYLRDYAKSEYEKVAI